MNKEWIISEVSALKREIEAWQQAIQSRSLTERKRADALGESEDKFRNLAEQPVAGVYLVQDVPGGEGACFERILE